MVSKIPRKMAQYQTIVRWLMACVTLQSVALALLATKYLTASEYWRNRTFIATNALKTAENALRTRDVLLAFSLLKVPAMAYDQKAPAPPDGWLLSREDWNVALPKRTQRILDALRHNPNTRLEVLLPAVEDGYTPPVNLSDMPPSTKDPSAVRLVNLMRRSPDAPPLHRRLSTLTGDTESVPSQLQVTGNGETSVFPVTDDWIDNSPFSH
jgi:hypothetical protein